MNNKVKTIIGAAVFVLFIVGASFAYNELRSRVDAPNLIASYQENSDNKETDNKKTDNKETDNKETDKNGTDNRATDNNGEQKDDELLASDFTVLDVNNNEVKLSDLFGKPIVLNFWASWCPPCKSEMPEFNKVYEEMGDEITFAMVSLTDGVRETIETANKYVQAEGFTFPVYFDTEGEAAHVYEISSIPTTIFIDKNGYVITEALGTINERTLRNGIDMIRG